MIIKTKDEYNKIKTAAKINTEALFMLRELTVPGISSYEIDRKAEEFYKKNKVKPAFKGYHGYPAVINFMIDDQVVHCIPNNNQIVQNGDLVSIDTGCIYEGYYADHATSFGIGEITPDDERLLYVGKLSMEEGCKQAISGNRVGDIGNAQQSIIEMSGFSVVKNFVGHEIGKQLHDPLKIPSFGQAGKGDLLPENMLLCIENQTCAGKPEVVIDKKDGWSVTTKDGKKCVTFEHMLIVKKGKPEILTQI